MFGLAQFNRLVKELHTIPGGTAMRARWLNHIGLTLARRRLLVVLGLGLILTLIEMIDHYNPGNSSLFQPEFWHRIPIYALILPLLTWILLNWVERGREVHGRTLLQIDHLKALQVTLTETTSWDKLLETIVQYPRFVMPVTGTAVYILTEDGGQFELGANWIAVTEQKGKVEPKLKLDNCSNCLLTSTTAMHEIRLCPISGDEAVDNHAIHLCAPLIYKGALTALLQVYLPADQNVSTYEMESLTRALPEMALAITNARLERSLAYQVEATSEVVTTERRRIAQDLHDTLAQDIGYLRLKLDQLCYDGTLHDIVEIQQDIERMRDTATEAYAHIRETLTILGPYPQKDLADIIQERAIQVSNRAGFKVIYEHRPDRFPLTTQVCQQMFLICQEALNNVEKHAEAKAVHIQLDWGQKDLTLNIIDDGKGYDSARGPDDGHFGLAIMKRRAESIGGRLNVSSEIGFGTRVNVCVPTARCREGQQVVRRKGGETGSLE